MPSNAVSVDQTALAVSNAKEAGASNAVPFEKMDINGDGVVSKDEYEKANHQANLDSPAGPSNARSEDANAPITQAEPLNDGVQLGHKDSSAAQPAADVTAGQDTRPSEELTAVNAKMLASSYSAQFPVQREYRLAMSASLAANYTEKMQQCLKGKHVTILGNSVSRHWYFVLRDILGEQGLCDKISRAGEMLECGRGGNSGGERPNQGICYGMCGCSIYAGPSKDTTLQFLWQQRIFDEEEEPILEGLCPDLLTINTGGDDLFDVNRRNEWKKSLDEQAPKLKDMLTKVLNKCPQTHLFWRTTTPLCQHNDANGDDVNQKGYGKSKDDMNSMIAQSNEKLKSMVSGLPRTKIFDSWAHNQGRCKDYDDNLHHSKLVEEHVKDLFGDYCGSVGHPL